MPLKRSFCYARPYPEGLEPEPDGPYEQMVSQSQLDRRPGEIKDRWVKRKNCEIGRQAGGNYCPQIRSQHLSTQQKELQVATVQE